MTVHGFHEAVEHRHRVVDDGLIACHRAVQQPARQFELGIQHGPLGDAGITALPCGGVGGDCRFGRVPPGGEQPVQIAARVAHAQTGPAENAGHGIVRDQEGIGRHRAVHHGGRELPEGVVIRGLFPPAQQRGGKVTGVRRLVNDLDRRGAALLRALLREPGRAHECRRQAVDGGNRASDRTRHSLVPGEGIRVEGVAGQQLVHDGARAGDRGLTHEFGHVERQSAAVSRCERTQRHEVGGLLGLGRLTVGNANDQRSIVSGHDECRVEHSVCAGAVSTRLGNVEPRDGGRGQRG
ncbi:hypothetical protein JF66_12120 [Cryobacterium sp. MLB-32]|nr:hypothetical protein JF66_12120 [Cryobacterium sp. MLB-32]